MPRFARVVVPTYPHHVTQRGNGRRDVFFTPADRQVYLQLLRKYSEYYHLQILGYCLMTNHVHVVAIPHREESLARTFREVHGRYAQYRNAADCRTGHVWQNRYYSCACEPSRLGSLMRYVELNPVRAGLSQSAGDYAWSSAVKHLGGADPLGLVDLELWRSHWTPEDWADGAARRRGRVSGHSGSNLQRQTTRLRAVRKNLGTTPEPPPPTWSARTPQDV